MGSLTGKKNEKQNQNNKNENNHLLDDNNYPHQKEKIFPNETYNQTQDNKKYNENIIDPPSYNNLKSRKIKNDYEKGNEHLKINYEKKKKN